MRIPDIAVSQVTFKSCNEGYKSVTLYLVLSQPYDECQGSDGLLAAVLGLASSCGITTEYLVSDFISLKLSFQ